MISRSQIEGESVARRRVTVLVGLPAAILSIGILLLRYQTLSMEQANSTEPEKTTHEVASALGDAEQRAPAARATVSSSRKSHEGPGEATRFRATGWIVDGVTGEPIDAEIEQREGRVVESSRVYGFTLRSHPAPIRCRASGYMNRVFTASPT